MTTVTAGVLCDENKPLGHDCSVVVPTMSGSIALKPCFEVCIYCTPAQARDWCNRVLEELDKLEGDALEAQRRSDE